MSPETEKLPLSDSVSFSGGHVSASIIKGQGFSVPANQLTIGVRQGGEKLLTRGHHHSIKNLFQEIGYPPHIRGHLPLVFLGDEVVGVASIPQWGVPGVVSDDFSVAEDEFGCEVAWSPPRLPIK